MMKTKLLHFSKLLVFILIALILTFPGKIKAQSFNWTTFSVAPGTVNPSGGNFDVGFNHNNYAAMGFQNTPKAAIFGNLDYSPILFTIYDGSTHNEFMRITNTGNVGIGTTTPGSILQLLNTTHTNPNTGYSALFAGTFSTMFRATASDCYLYANSYYTNAASHIYASNGGAASLSFNASGAGNIDFYTAPSGTAGGTITYTKRMTLLQNGNVGIGTTSPVNKLDISGGLAVGASYAGTAAPTDGAIINGNVGIGTTSPSCKLNVITTVNTPAIRGTSTVTSGVSYGGYFETSGLGASQAYSLYAVSGGGASSNYTLYLGSLSAATNNYAIYSAGAAQSYFQGNVGIGIASPAYALDVQPTAAVVARLKGSASSGTSDNVQLRFAGGKDGEMWSIGSDIAGGGATKDFEFYDLTAGATRMMINSSGQVGIGLTNPAYKLEVTGSFNVNGAASCTAGIWSSDQMFKTNVDSIQNALAIIKQLKPRTYYFDTANVWGLNFPAQKQYGFVAQDLEQVLPELVTTIKKNAVVDTTGNIVHPATTYKGVYYLELIAFLTKGIQEQQHNIDSLTTKTNNQDSINNALNNRVNQLAAKTNNQDTVNTLLQNQLNQLLTAINTCCSHSMQSPTDGSGNQQTKSMTIPQGAAIQTDVQLNDVQTIVLEQNVPNPFAEQTTINYSLPNNISKAQMLFYNSQGKLIQSTELVQKGRGQLNVFASDLSNGIYTYTLVVDGKIIETKKMVKQ